MKRWMAVVVLVVGQWLSYGQVADLTVPLGGGLTTFLRDQVPNNSVIRLLPGTYTVTPSILNSNLQNANQFTGATLANKTNITIIGVPGQTIIDGSAAPGEVLWITNCANMHFYGVTFVGWTNHNFMNWPINSQLLWAGVNFLKSERLTFDTCAIVRHADHGLQDKGAETPSNPASSPLSTNQIIVRNCYFHDIGSTRTNTAGGTLFVDGTAIVCSTMTIENNVFDTLYRGIEPYDEGAALPNSQRFFNTIIRNNSFRNLADFSINPAGSTNGQNILIEGNVFDNDLSWSFHGTNFNTSTGPSPWNACLYNASGRAWTVRNNHFRGHQSRAVYFYGVTDGVIQNNSFWGITNRAGISGAAIQLEGTTNILVQGNYMRGMKDAGVYLFGAKNTTVEGNTILEPGNGYGIQIATSGGLTASNNFIRNNRIEASNTAIWDQTGNLLQHYVFGNEVVAPTKIGNSSGDFMHIEGPPRVFNYTNDFPSIAAGGSFRTNFPAIGAKTNDFAYLMTPDQFYRIGTNISVNTWASNDVVWVWIHNNGPSAADPGSVRFKAVVKQVEAY
jgi:parallel beta-helix repeat protein